MRLIRPLLAIACLGLGILVGALNREPAIVDLGPVVLATTLGVALLAAVLIGAVAGGAAVALGGRGPVARRKPVATGAQTGPEA